jgi:hypothetical protein
MVSALLKTCFYIAGDSSHALLRVGLNKWVCVLVKRRHGKNGFLEEQFCPYPFMTFYDNKTLSSEPMSAVRQAFAG